ncbi:MAG: hypothetical protein K8R35_00260 [Bacteroidales bacterium]|nr:hypothetical protein [Bacteroidales bacterium]
MKKSSVLCPVLISILIILLGLTGESLHGQQIKLLVIIDDSQPLKVDYITRNDINKKNYTPTEGGVIWFSWDAVRNSPIENRNERYSVQLQELIGDYPDREKYIKDMLENAFCLETDKIVLSFTNIKDSKEYLSHNKPNFNSLENDSWKHVMIVKEIAGFSTPKNNLGKLCTSTKLNITVYEIIKKERIFQQDFISYPGEAYELDSVLTNKNLFISDYPNIHNSGLQIYAFMKGKDVLHRMAKNYGLESYFPPVSEVLKDYSKNFSLKIYKPNGWKKTRQNDYSSICNPKKYKDVVTITTFIDLLIKPLGTNNLTLNEYSELYFSRLNGIGIVPRNLDKDIQIIDLKDQWISFMFDNPKGGIGIVFQKKIKNEYILIHEVKLIDDNYTKLLNDYEQDIEDYLNYSKLIFK